MLHGYAKPRSVFARQLATGAACLLGAWAAGLWWRGDLLGVLIPPLIPLLYACRVAACGPRGEVPAPAPAAADDDPPTEPGPGARQQAELLRVVFDHIPVMVVVFGPDGEPRLANRAFEDVVGWSIAEMRGHDMVAEVYPDPAEQARARRFISEAASSWGEFQTRTRRRGTIRALWANVRLSDGSTIGIGQDVTRLHDAQERLRFQNALLTAQAETTTEAIAAFAPDGRVLSANRRFRQMWELSDEIIASAPEGTLLAHAIKLLDDPEGFQARVMELRHDACRRARDVITFRDGRIFDRYTSPLIDEGGTYHGRVWYFHDATEMRRTTGELAEWKSRYDAAVEASGQLLYQWDTRTDTTVVSGNCEQILGYSKAEMGPGHIADFIALIHPDDRAAFTREMERVRQTRHPFQLDYRLRRKDGTYIYVADSGRFFTGADGQVDRLVGFLSDITQRVEAQRHVEASERFARATVDALQAEIAILDESGAIVAVNAAWRQFARDNAFASSGMGVGLNYMAVAGRAAADPHDPGAPLAAAACDGIGAVLRGARPEFYLEYPCHSPQAERWFAMRVTRFDVGTGPRVVVAHENITGRHVAERLEREKVGLRDAVKSMEQVLGVVGHELRTPLAALRAISEFLITDGARSTDVWDRFLHDIGNEVDRMSDTVNNLLEAARLNSGRARWNWGEVDLAGTCAEAIESVRPLVDRTRVELSMDVEPSGLTPDGGGRPITGDGEALRRLVTNLLSNARKHTADGSIRVTVRPGETDAGGARWAEVTVCDTGSGIPPDVLARLGEAFALNSGVVGANHVSGTGLGLAICKGIVAAHGGTLTVRSAVGRGTTITARIRTDLAAAAEGDTVRAEPQKEWCAA